jgi:hypothetical protein
MIFGSQYPPPDLEYDIEQLSAATPAIKEASMRAQTSAGQLWNWERSVTLIAKKPSCFG